jgi:hypothetical protein
MRAAVSARELRNGYRSMKYREQGKRVGVCLTIAQCRVDIRIIQGGKSAQ